MSGRHAAPTADEPAGVPATVPGGLPAALAAELASALPAVIALGSNQGDREALLRDAVRAIDAIDGVRVTAASGIVETPALKLHGVDESAPSYLNAVVLASVLLGPEELLKELHTIEASLGRVRDEVWGDRTIDLDLIDLGGIVRETDHITMPHPRAWQRAFVLAPWLQVQPDAVLAGHGSDGHGTDGHASYALAPNGHAFAGHGRVDSLLAATTDRVTEFPAAPLFVVHRSNWQAPESADR